MPNKKIKSISPKRKRVTIPRKQTGFRSCKPIKHVFELLMFKKMIHKNMIIIFKYTPISKYENVNTKDQVKIIKEGIISRKYKIPIIYTVSINGVFNVVDPYHIKVLMAIRSISYSIVKSNLNKVNVSVLSYPYISKEETIKMINHTNNR